MTGPAPVIGGTSPSRCDLVYAVEHGREVVGRIPCSTAQRVAELDVPVLLDTVANDPTHGAARENATERSAIVSRAGRRSIVWNGWATGDVNAGVGSSPMKELGLDPSFDAFYREHHASAFRWAAALVGRRAVAEDLAHDALIQTGARLSSIENPAAYLRRSVVNTCRSWHRTAGREAARHRRASVGEEFSTLSDTTVEVLDVLSRLPYRQRAAVVLRFWADWSDADIAHALGCRESSVRVMVHRGLASLRSQLVEGKGQP